MVASKPYFDFNIIIFGLYFPWSNVLAQSGDHIGWTAFRIHHVLPLRQMRRLPLYIHMNNIFYMQSFKLPLDDGLSCIWPYYMELDSHVSWHSQESQLPEYFVHIKCSASLWFVGAQRFHVAIWTPHLARMWLKVLQVIVQDIWGNEQTAVRLYSKMDMFLWISTYHLAFDQLLVFLWCLPNR